MRGTILEHSAALSGRSVCLWPAVLPRVAHLFCIVISMGAFWLPNGPKKPSQAGGPGVDSSRSADSDTESLGPQGARTRVSEADPRGRPRRPGPRGDVWSQPLHAPCVPRNRGTQTLLPLCAAPPAPHPRALRAERGREGHAQTGVGGTVGQGPTRWRTRWVSRIRDQMRTRRIVSGSFLVPRRRVRPTVPHVTDATSPPKGSSSPLRLRECSRRKT